MLLSNVCEGFSIKKPLQKQYFNDGWQKEIGDKTTDKGSFRAAVKQVTPTVVYITTSQTKYQIYSNQEPSGMGSGVIIDSLGYIVTNNHVIEKSKRIDVTLYNRRTYEAKIVGTDPATDLALLKIDAPDLPSVDFGNSDSLQIGDWVIAIGNPFGLKFTVTLGIVSAKARSLSTLNVDDAVEAFIQTDAAINRGNSGGPLVDINGKLVGINTAISSISETYIGYAFAVPSNMVKKVVEDLQRYGMVHRGYLNMKVKEIDHQIATDLQLESMFGVYIEDVFENGAAKEAGLLEKDIIVAVHGYPVTSVAEYTERIALFSPADIISITVIREGKEMHENVQLKGITKESDIGVVLGADFKNLSVSELRHFGLRNGIRITDVSGGLLQNYTKIKSGFILTQNDNGSIDSVEHFFEQVKKMKKGDTMKLTGFYPNNRQAIKTYPFTMR